MYESTVHAVVKALQPEPDGIEVLSEVCFFSRLSGVPRGLDIGR